MKTKTAVETKSQEQLEVSLCIDGLINLWAVPL